MSAVSPMVALLLAVAAVITVRTVMTVIRAGREQEHRGKNL